MDFRKLLTFLEALDRNNSREWMHENLVTYKQVRNEFIHWLDATNDALAAVDPAYYPTPGKKAISRINNNLMFHPNKPVYKDHFGAVLDKAPGTADFYLEVGLKGSLFAGGFWRPESKKLKSIRDAIDYEGEELLEIINKPAFKATFTGLYVDEQLRTAPKGFQSDHPYIGLLRNKTFAVIQRVPNDVMWKSDFRQMTLKAYETMLPFRRWLNKAVTV